MLHLLALGDSYTIGEAVPPEQRWVEQWAGLMQAEGHAIAGRIKADILRSHPEVVSVLVHVEPEIVELIGTYDTTLTRHIFESFVATAQITLHVRVLNGRNAHHVVEAQFKSVARSLRDAVTRDARVVGVPS